MGSRAVAALISVSSWVAPSVTVHYRSSLGLFATDIRRRCSVCRVCRGDEDVAAVAGHGVARNVGTTGLTASVLLLTSLRRPFVSNMIAEIPIMTEI